MVPAVSAPEVCLTKGEAKELLGLDGCIQRVTELQARLLTSDGSRNSVNMNYDKWKALFAELQSVPNLTGLAETKKDRLPPVEVLKIWERELRARLMQKRSDLQLRGLIQIFPDLVGCGIEEEAAQRICSYA